MYRIFMLPRSLRILQISPSIDWPTFELAFLLPARSYLFLRTLSCCSFCSNAIAFLSSALRLG